MVAAADGSSSEQQRTARMFQDQGTSVRGSSSVHSDDTAVTVADPNAPQPAAVSWGLSLTLQPKALNDAFWEEQAHKYARMDAQVAWFFTVLLVPLTIHRVTDVGWSHSIRVFAPAWLHQLSWLLAMSYPSFYWQHRARLVMVVKALMVYQTLHATNQIGDRFYASREFSHLAPEVSIFLKMVLIANVPYFPAWVVCLPAPFQLQYVWICISVTLFYLSGCTRELVTYGNTPEYLRVLDSSNAVWCSLVQSGTPAFSAAITAASGADLQDRSASMAVAMLVISLSTIAGTMYIAYINQWIEICRWLKQKTQVQTDAAGTRPPPRTVCINGVVVSRRQLMEVCHTPFANLLLGGRGVLGISSMVLLHCSVLSALCLVTVLLSQLLLLCVVPQVVPPAIQAMYFPIRPEVGDATCRPDEAPQFTGWLGRLLLALGR